MGENWHGFRVALAREISRPWLPNYRAAHIYARASSAETNYDGEFTPFFFLLFFVSKPRNNLHARSRVEIFAYPVAVYHHQSWISRGKLTYAISMIFVKIATQRLIAERSSKRKYSGLNGNVSIAGTFPVYGCARDVNDSLVFVQTKQKFGFQIVWH